MEKNFANTVMEGVYKTLSFVDYFGVIEWYVVNLTKGFFSLSNNCWIKIPVPIWYLIYLYGIILPHVLVIVMLYNRIKTSLFPEVK